MVKYWILIALLLIPILKADAQGISFGDKEINLPEPIQNLWNTFGKIKVDINKIPYAERIISDAGGFIREPGSLISGITGIWDKFNTWLESTIGVSFKEIFTAIGNFLVWIFELVVKLLKLALSKV